LKIIVKNQTAIKHGSKRRSSLGDNVREPAGGGELVEEVVKLTRQIESLQNRLAVQGIPVQ
jgi:hypothetical protein